MSSEIYLHTLTLPLPEDHPLPDATDDRVLQTAGDRPDPASLPTTPRRLRRAGIWASRGGGEDRKSVV